MLFISFNLCVVHSILLTVFHDGMQTVNKDLGRVEQVSMSLLRKLENQAMDLKSPQLLVQDSTSQQLAIIYLSPYYINDMTCTGLPWDYLCNFEWEGRFSKRDKLPDLTKRLADVGVSIFKGII